jgi:nucleoside-diphosphate-sugar epimerase
MRIAIFGATSQIGKDLVSSFVAHGTDELVLFARRPEAVKEWLVSWGASDQCAVADFAEFSHDQRFDALINFVGVGNPAQAVAMGASIFDVTLKFDELALEYVRRHPDCRYLFLSSGAAYGAQFDEPVDENTPSIIAINNLKPQDWYAVAKLHAECRHRSLPHLPIVDIRVFSYFSRTQDISARFFISDTVRAIHSGETLITSPENIVRDYLGPDDFYRLISLVLTAPAVNDVIDCYTKAPVDKMALLAAMQLRFGLSYEVAAVPVGINATGAKMNYFSKNRKAKIFGYYPSVASIDGVLNEAAMLVSADVQRQ